MEDKKALIVCKESLLSEIVAYTLKKLSCSVDMVDNPKDAVSKAEKENYFIIVIGNNNGTIVKHKLAEIIYNKSLGRPNVVIFKEQGEIIPKAHYLKILDKPDFYKTFIEILQKESPAIRQIYSPEESNLSNFIKIPNFKKTDVASFFKHLKGNVKFHIRTDEHEILGFTMGADIFILKSTLNNIYDILTLKNTEIATEPLSLNEFLSLTLDTKTFKINFRDFIVNCINNINNKDELLSMLPDKKSMVTLKAPVYIVKQIDLINDNINIEKLHSNPNTTIEELIKEDDNLEKTKAVVCMYMLNMIDIEKPIESKKYDVKIKKSFLKKIIDKIRGL